MYIHKGVHNIYWNSALTVSFVGMKKVFAPNFFLQKKKSALLSIFKVFAPHLPAHALSR